MEEKHFKTDVRLANNIDNASILAKDFLKQVVSYIFEKGYASRFTEEEILENIDANNFDLKYFTYFNDIEGVYVKYQIFVVEGIWEEDEGAVVFINKKGFESFDDATAEMQSIINNIG